MQILNVHYIIRTSVLPLNCSKVDGLKKFSLQYTLDSSNGILVGLSGVPGGNNSHDFLKQKIFGEYKVKIVIF